MSEPLQKGFGANEDGNEYFSAPEEIKKQIKLLAEAISKGGCVAYTGAGISTSSNLLSYRGPEGVWTKLEKGQEPQHKIAMEDAVPSSAHTALHHLMNAKLLDFVVSTNIDGLHRKSGIEASQLAELHGNIFLEICRDCKHQFWRDFNVVASQEDHLTGRQCTECNGPLMDSIIHFKEGLNPDTFERARAASAIAKTALVLGTSLRVRPAKDLPAMAEKMFIVNLQKTPHDERAVGVIRARTDLVMALLMQELGYGEHHAPPPSGWEAEYEVLAAESARKEQEFSRQALKAIITPQVSLIKPKGKNELIGLKSQAKIEVAPTMREAVLIRACEDCTFHINNNNCVKLVVLDCANVSIVVAGRLLTGVLEVINSTAVRIAIVRAVPTIQIDGSQVTIGFVKPDLIGSIVTSANSRLNVATASEQSDPTTVLSGAQDDDAMLQYVTRFIDGELATEQVIRENGYATTVREKTAADEKDARNAKLLEKYLSTLIK